MATILQGNFIESLSSKVYYRTMFESQTDYCFGSDDNREFKEARSKLNKYGKISSIENRLMKALCRVSFTSTGDDCDKQCHKLYCWLGNELFNKLEEDSFSDVIGILEDVSHALSGRDKCKCNFFKDVKKEKIEKMKIVSDYCEDYETIESTLKAHNYTCDKNVSNYLLKATDAYEEMYECTQENSKSYCKELKKHVPSCFEKKLSSLTCKIKDLTANEQGTSPYNTTNLDLEYVINVSAFSSSQIFLFFVLPFVGIFFIGFLLYKFTPIVSCIHNKVLKKKSIRRNLDEMDILELTEYTNEQRKSNLGRKQLNVAYHAA
ncbi:PIR protein [Plasmodium malariae]|uniref:PIR protein n=1 Tax=Plasmodium malariae TaxID=5858 RepID=A0A1D3JHT5_PLAMA|nr:PIR protein [Plasmodium malariae]SBT85964.1 PIR protein [Plasmodium malariae]